MPDLAYGSLESDPDLLEVVGFGRLRPPSGNAQEVEIEILFSTLNERYAPADPPEIRRYWLGIGQLIDFSIGSRWRSRERVGDRFDRPGAPALTVRGLEFRREAALGLAARDATNAMFAAGLSGTSFYIVTVIEPENRGEKIPTLAVPAWELFRGLWGASSEFLVQVADALRNPSLVRDRILYDRNKSGRIDADTVHVHAYKELSDREALLIGMLLTDDRFREAHHMVSQSLTTAPGWGNPNGVRVALPFYPFGGATNMSFHERWFDEAGAGKRRVALRVGEIELAPKFSTVEVSYPSSEHATDAPPARSRIRIGRARKVVLQTGLAPSLIRPPVTVESKSAAFISTATPILFVRLPRGAPVLPASLTVIDDPAEEAWGSTADRVLGGVQEVRHVRIASSDDPEVNGGAPLSDSPHRQMKLTLLALQSLEQAQEDWHLTIGGVAGGESSATQRIGGSGSSGLDVLLVALSTNRGHVVIVDGGTVSADRRSLGVIARRDLQAFGVSEIESLKQFAAVVGLHWRTARVPPEWMGWRARHHLLGLTRSRKLWELYGEDDKRAEGAVHYREQLKRSIEAVLADRAP